MRSLLAALAALLALAALPLARAADFAVIVSGSLAWDNLRHQADASHAYQLVRRNGIPAENIITFMYDDIANNSFNPFPGQIFNKPSPAGTPGDNVFAGVRLDYTGDSISPDSFLAVLRGNASALPPGCNGTGRVLRSTAEDRVFIYLVSHGGVGLVAFPNDLLYNTRLIDTLKYMYSKRMYKQMIFYLESCESGSVFDGLLDPRWNIYAMTAANGAESSWGSNCPPDDYVDGKNINSCLGDVFSTNTESSGVRETLEAQFFAVQAETNHSHVSQYGNLNFTTELVGEFMGGVNDDDDEEEDGARGLGQQQVEADVPTTPAASPRSSGVVSARDIPMHLAYYRYLRAPLFSADSAASLAALRRELDAREATLARFTLLAELLSLDGAGQRLLPVESMFAAPAPPVLSGPCVVAGVDALREHGCAHDAYSLQFHSVIVNACRLHAPRAEDEDEAAVLLAKSVAHACYAHPQPGRS